MMRKNGFTIIETSLVLAIAGLILTLAFVVLPTLWRSQRDSQRKEDIMTYASAVKKFQSNNNRGALPTESQLDTVRSKYISTSFEDPDGGGQYTFSYYACSGKTGDVCSNAVDAIKADTFNTRKIYFVASASCNESNEATKSANSRKAALMYKLEVNDIYCYEL